MATLDDIKNYRHLIADINLGPMFDYVGPDAQYEHDLGSFTHIIYGGRIGFNTPGYNHEKAFVVWARFDKDSLGDCHVDGQYSKDRIDSINVSVSKTAEQISKDITRRLIPEFLRLARINSDAIAETEAYLNGKIAMGKAIKAAYPTLRLHDSITGVRNKEQYARGTDVTLEGKGIKVVVNRSTCELTLSDLTVDQVRALLEYIPAVNGGDND